MSNAGLEKSTNAMQTETTPHFLQEIMEQPSVLSYTLAQYLKHNYQIKMNRPPLDDQALREVQNVLITACGTSYHAGLCARYVVEELAQIPTVVEPASECGRHHLLVDRSTLAIGVSQSGRSPDTLEALELASRRGASTLAVVNDADSPLAALAAGSLLTLAGKTFSMSSTKAFTSQLLVLALLGLRLAQSRGLPREQWRREVDCFSALPELFRAALMRGGLESKVKDLAGLLGGYRGCFILGRGHLHPMALEGALKLKEVAKIHSEGYLVGEFGHGPLALASPETPVIMFSFSDENDPNALPLAAELKRRGVPLVLISDGGPNKDQAIASLADHFLPLPTAPARLRPMIAVIPLQLLACHLGVLKGLDVDRPGGALSPELHSGGPEARGPLVSGSNGGSDGGYRGGSDGGDGGSNGRRHLV
jgi:glucosamine--fructose-6-phosphate aminotransferase (isomerizing)